MYHVPEHAGMALRLNHTHRIWWLKAAERKGYPHSSSNHEICDVGETSDVEDNSAA